MPRPSQTSTPDPRRHRRDPDKHRQEILAAAGAAFAEHGYQRATLRDIAGRAGVTHGSVLRHFGSKEQLFLAAMPGPRDLANVAEGPLNTLAERITAAYLDRMQGAGNSDPFVALLRSAGGDDAAATGLLLAMQESTDEVYRRLLGPQSLISTVPFLASLLIGVTFTRYVARRGTLAEMSTEQCRHYLQAAVQALIDAAPPEPSPPASPDVAALSSRRAPGR